MTKRQGLLLALVLASGSTLLTYIWYSGRSPAPAAARSAPRSKPEPEPVAIQPAGARPTAGGLVVPRYQRAVAIEVDASRGAGSLAQPSDHVDVLLTASDARAPHLAETILQDVPVLGPTTTGKGADAAPAREGKRQLVVAVTPQDAQRLMAAQIRGTLVVTLRNPTDREYAYVRPIANPQPSSASVTPAAPKTPPASAVRASAAPPAHRPVRRARRPVSMASVGTPPEPVGFLAPPPLPATPVVRQVPLPPPPSPAMGPQPKTIEVVRGTTVQTVTVKE